MTERSERQCSLELTMHFRVWRSLPCIAKLFLRRETSSEANGK
jgi:hypothetical protein